jgi:epoxyqueuosine reductase
MKLLLHICCAPCSVACVKSLRAEGIEPTGYWFNPNIHPFTEYRARHDALTGYAETIGLALEGDNTYGLRPFARAVSEDIAGRCRVCYATRMRETARYAAEHGFTHFSSTLFLSPYQKHDLLRLAAQDAAEEFGVPFLYRDFRPLFREGQEEARALNLYIQKYCGCIFSEEERYSNRLRKLAAKAAKKAREAGIPPEALDTEADRNRLKAELRQAGLAFEAARTAEEQALASRAGVPEPTGLEHR